MRNRQTGNRQQRPKAFAARPCYECKRTRSQQSSFHRASIHTSTHNPPFPQSIASHRNRNRSPSRSPNPNPNPSLAPSRPPPARYTTPELPVLHSTLQSLPLIPQISRPAHPITHNPSSSPHFTSLHLNSPSPANRSHNCTRTRTRPVSVPVPAERCLQSPAQPSPKLTLRPSSLICSLLGWLGRRAMGSCFDARGAAWIYLYTLPSPFPLTAHCRELLHRRSLSKLFRPALCHSSGGSITCKL